MMMLAFSIIIFLYAVIFHECAHGWVAYKLGDPTAKYSGRLTLNPLVHIDPIGTILLPVMLILMRSSVVFGWAKPVPVNFWNLRNPKRDMIWVGLAGPLTNIILAVILSSFLKIGIIANSILLNNIFAAGAFINLALGIFNIIPIPPLDGSRVVMGVLPRELSYWYAGLEPFGFLILILLMYLGIINKVVLPLIFFAARYLGIA